MRKAIDTLIGVVIGFIATFLLTTVGTYFFGERGQITSGVATTGGRWFTLIQIDNYSNDTLNGIRVMAPSAISVNQIFAVPPVRIQPLAGTADGSTMRFAISVVEPTSITRIFVPAPSRQDAENVRVSNAVEARVIVRSAGAIENRTLAVVKSALWSSLLYAVFLGVFTWFWETRNERLLKRIDEFKTQRAETQTRVEELEKAVKEAGKLSETSLRRIRVVLMARLHDYAKELSFWRSTMRQLLVGAGVSKREAAELELIVTRTLKTFGTRFQAFDDENWQAIEHIAALLERPQQP